jgi:hypothetical protein
MKLSTAAGNTGYKGRTAATFNALLVGHFVIVLVVFGTHNSFRTWVTNPQPARLCFATRCHFC